MDDLTDPSELYRRVLECEPGADEELYTKLVRRFKPVIWNRLQREDAQDLLHDLYMATWDSIRADAIHEPSKLWIYVASTCRILCFNLYRRYSRERRNKSKRDITGVLSSTALADCGNLTYPSFTANIPNPEQQAIRAEVRDQVRETIPTILHGHRITEHYLEELTHKEMKERAMEEDPGLTPVQAQTRIRLETSRAKARLVATMRQRMRSKPGGPLEQMAA